MASLITALNTTITGIPSSSTLFLHRSNNNKQPTLRPNIISSSSSPTSYGFAQFRINQQYLQKKQDKMKRGLLMVTRAAPTTNTLIFAFVFPLSLLIFTVFTSLKIANKLDQQYLEELAINQTIMEGREEEDEDSPILPEEEKPELSRSRNRPKRQA